MTTIEFTIPYRVQPKQADRQSIRFKGKKPYVHHHQAAKVEVNAVALASLCQQHKPEAPLGGPLRLTVVVLYPWRKAEPKKNRLCPRWKDTSPDTEQIQKQLCDVFESMGFCANDAQFALVTIAKMWSDAPRVKVRIEQLPIAVRELEVLRFAEEG